MGVTRQDHVDPRHYARHLLVHIKAVVAQAYDQFGPFGADLVHHFLHTLVADTERVFGEHPAGVGDRHIGESLPDHRDFDAACLVELVGREKLCRFVPFGVKDVLPQGGKGQPLDNLCHAVRAEREFPVKSHRVGLERIHHVDHVLTLRVVAGVAAVPGVAAIQQQRIGPVRADLVDHTRHTVQTAHLAIALRQRRKIVIGQRIGRGAAVRDPVKLAEIRAGQMRHLPAVLAHTDIDRRFAEIDRFQLRVNVGHVDQADTPEGVKFKQFVLRQRLLRGKLAPDAKGRRTIQSRCSHAGLKEITTRDHRLAFSTRNSYAHI